MSERIEQYKVLQWAFSFLQKYRRETKVAERLLEHHLNMSREEFLLHMRTPIDEAVRKRFEEDIIRHAKTGVPLEHLTGYKYFYGRKFFVNEDVLIPRFETEELVGHVIYQVKHRSENAPVAIVDLGTGSGVIAITLALELENVHVYATDISERALNMAKKNANEHHAKVTFFQGNFLEPIIKRHIKVDYIVSNPPYIAREEAPLLQDTVRDFEPELALFAESDGLGAYETILQQVEMLEVEKKLFLSFEIGHTQSKAVHALIQRNLRVKFIETIQDINGKDRIVTAKIS